MGSQHAVIVALQIVRNSLVKRFWKYQLTSTSGKLQWEKKSIETNNFDLLFHDAEVDSVENSEEPTEDPTYTLLSRLAQRHFSAVNRFRNVVCRKGVGCGKRFKWSNLPKIEDELILELFKVKTIDQAKQLIQNGSFTEARQNYESNIDKTFST